MTTAKQPPLRCCVMTSSSARSLGSLFREVGAISAVHSFDLMVLREVDVQQIARETGRIPRGANDALASVTEVIANDDLCREIVFDWVHDQCTANGIDVPALATYFPDLTCLDQDRWELAVRALVNTSLLALRLAYGKDPCMRVPIVEIVAGTILDPCHCARCKAVKGDANGDANGSPVEQRQFVLSYSRKAKMHKLCAALKEVLRRVSLRAAEAGAPASKLPCFAVELEPGPTYVLNDQRGLMKLLQLLRTKFQALLPHVGYNLDVAHWLIAGVDPRHADLDQLRPRIVHSHIADHPGRGIARMHTRDQPLGTFTSVEHYEGEYYPWLDLLNRRAREYRPREPGAIPFSSAVAVELEGTNRIFWIHQSVSHLRHALLLSEERSGGGVAGASR